MSLDYRVCQCGEVYIGWGVEKCCSLCEDRVCPDCARKELTVACTACNCAHPFDIGRTTRTTSTYVCTLHSCPCLTRENEEMFVCDICRQYTIPDAKMLEFLLAKVGMDSHAAEKEYRATPEYAAFLRNFGTRGKAAVQHRARPLMVWQ